MKSCLVVYYSRTGMTRKMAEAIALQYGCDIEAIHEDNPRTGMFNYLRSGYEALTRKVPDINRTVRNPADYSLTILGTPVWGSHMSSPMRSYITRNKDRFNQVAAFCTMGGSGGDKALDDIGALCGKKLVGRMKLTDKEIDSNQAPVRVAEFGNSFVTAT
ncbi:MAG: flavodoxin family protein [Burkholderiaceae bacterium]